MIKNKIKINKNEFNRIKMNKNDKKINLNEFKRIRIHLK